MAVFDLSTLGDAALSHKKIFSVQQARAMRDIAIAIAEGAPGATKIAQRTFSGAATVGNDLDITGCDAFGGLTIHLHFTNDDGVPGSVTLEFSDNASTFYGAVTLFNVAANIAGSATVFVDFESGDVTGAMHQGTNTTAAISQTVSGASLDVRTVRLNAVGCNISALVILHGGESAPDAP